MRVSICHPERAQGREGLKGSWCVDCGVKVYEVHDRPCSECAHIFNSAGYYGCRRQHMAVSPSMLVMYPLIDVGGQKAGVCFEALTHQPPDQDTSGDQRPRLPETGDESQVG